MMQRELQLKAIISEPILTDLETLKVARDKRLFSPTFRSEVGGQHFPLPKPPRSQQAGELNRVSQGEEGGPDIGRSKEDTGATYINMCSAHTPPNLQE